MTERKKAKKPSTNKKTAETRHGVFVERYLVNGNNSTEAAKFAGYSEHTAGVQGSRLLRHPNVIAMLGNRAQQVLVDAQLSTDRWAKEMACIGHVDPGELYDEAGNLIPIHLLPEHVRRAIASVEPTEEGMKIKLWDKNTALANIGKHLGVFERDNTQKTEGIKVLIQLVG